MMFAQWQLEPEPCSKCGSGRWVMWYARISEPKRLSSLWCQHCLPDLAATQLVLAVAVNLAGKVYVWQRLGTALESESVATLDHWLHTAAQLQRHRGHERARPGEWKLELGDDGRLWMPWNRATGGEKSGGPWPLRRATLGKSRRNRKCMVCSKAVSQGDTVYRADLAFRDQPELRRKVYKERNVNGALGWSRATLDAVFVCQPCGNEALVATAEPSASGHRVVGHLVVVDGGGC